MQSDIDAFKRGYETWPSEAKALINMYDVNFVIGTDQPVNNGVPYDHVRKEVDLDTKETSRQDFRKDGQAVALFQALMCVMRDHLPAGLQWAAAEKEMIKSARAQGMNVGHWSNTSMLANVYRSIAQGNREGLEDTCPISLKIYDRFMEAVKAEVYAEAKYQHRETNEQVRKIAPASDTEFTINRQVLSKPQQEFFEKLNKVVSILGVSPKELDNEFRISVLRQIHSNSVKFSVIGGGELEKRKLARVRPENELMQLEGVPFEYQNLHILAHKFTSNKMSERAIEQINSITRRDQLMMEFFDPWFGTINAPLESLPTDDALHSVREKTIELRTLYENEFGQEVRLTKDKTPPKKGELFHIGNALPADANILQRFADSQAFAELPDVQPSITVLNRLFYDRAKAHSLIGEADIGGNGLMTFPSAEAHFANAMRFAVLDTAKAKHIEGAQREELMQTLQEMKELWPDVTLSKAEYEKREARKAFNAAPKQQQAAKPSVPAPDVPKPYPLPAFTRGSDDEWIAETKGLCNALDCRNASHKQLGDLLLSDPVFKIIAAAAAHQTGNLSSALTESKNKGVVQALQNAVIQLKPLLKPEEGAALSAADQKVADQLLKSPLLLSCVTAKTKVIQEAGEWAGMDDVSKREFIEATILPTLYPPPRVEVAVDDAPTHSAPSSPPAPPPADETPTPPAPPVDEAPVPPAPVVETPAPTIIPAVVTTTVAAPPPPPANDPPASDPQPPTGQGEAITPRRIRTPTYVEAERKAIEKARAHAASAIEQTGCNELYCRPVASASGYEIWLEFGRDGKISEAQGKPMEFSLSLNKVTSIDDAVDILRAVEGALFNEYGLKPPMRLYEKDEAFGTKKAEIEYVKVISKSQVPEKIMDMEIDPAHVPVMGEPDLPRKVPPRQPDEYINVRIVNVDGAAVLCIDAWEAKQQGKARICKLLDLPLGVELEANQAEASARAQHVIEEMQHRLNQGDDYTKQNAMDELKAYAEVHGTGWFEAPVHYVDGYSSSKVSFAPQGSQQYSDFRFPHAAHNQDTKLRPVRLYKAELEGGNETYYVQTGIEACLNKDDRSQESWQTMSNISINLHTANEELAEARAQLVMDRIMHMLEHPLNTGQQVDGRVKLPQSHHWMLDANGNAQEGGQAASDWQDAAIGKKKIDALLDYFVQTFADDLSVRRASTQLDADKMTFKLQLVRATRENYPPLDEPLADRWPISNRYYHTEANGGNAPDLTGEVLGVPVKTPDESGARPNHPAELVFEIKRQAADGHVRDEAEMNALANEFTKKVDASVKTSSSEHYRSFACKNADDYIKPPAQQRWDLMTAVNDFASAVKSHWRAVDGLTIDPGQQNDSMKAKMPDITRNGGGRTRRSKLPENPSYLPPEMRNHSLKPTDGGWAGRVDDDISPTRRWR